MGHLCHEYQQYHWVQAHLSVLWTPIDASTFSMTRARKFLQFFTVLSKYLTILSLESAQTYQSTPGRRVSLLTRLYALLKTILGLSQWMNQYIQLETTFASFGM